jgi:hypothetical protein
MSTILTITSSVKFDAEYDGSIWLHFSFGEILEFLCLFTYFPVEYFVRSFRSKYCLIVSLASSVLSFSSFEKSVFPSVRTWCLNGSGASFNTCMSIGKFVSASILFGRLIVYCRAFSGFFPYCYVYVSEAVSFL